MIKVLQITDALLRRFGVTSVIMNYYRNIDRSKVQFDFLVIESEPNYVEEIESLGGHIYYMPRLGLLNANAFIKFIGEFMSKYGHEYIAIHSHFYQLDSIIFPIAKKYGIKNCISHSHGTHYSNYKLKAVRNMLLSFRIKKHATHFFACSQKAGKFMFGNRIVESNQLIVLKNAIDCNKFRYEECIRGNLRKEFGFDDRLIVGHIGSFNKTKNHVFLINVFREIIKRNDNAILLLIGDGELKNEIIEMVKNSDLSDHVFFLGIRDDINELMQMIDCLVLPSLHEGLPVVMIEAQAAGLFSVVSDSITQEVKLTEYIHFLSLYDNVNIWAEKILESQSSVRTDTQHLIASQGYDIESAADNLMSFYCSLV